MKKITISLSVLIMIAISAFSQEENANQTKLDFDIIEQTREMSEGENPALVMFIPGSEDDVAKDLWEDFMDQYDAKTKKGLFSSEYTTEEAHIYSVGGVNKVDVFTKINSKDEGTEVVSWFRLAENDYVSSSAHKNSLEEAKNIMNNFGLMVRKKTLELAVEEEEEKLSDLEDDLEDLKDENEDLKETIEDAKKTIEESEDALVENNKAQEELGKSLADQQKALEQARKRYQTADQ